MINVMTSFNQLSGNGKAAFDKICKLAFNATVKSKQVFTTNDVKSIFSDVSTQSELSSLGLVVTDRYFMRYGLDETYTFLHLTFQEYLAAVHIARLSESQQIDVIKTHHAKRHLTVVWRFLRGMMDYTSVSAMDTFKTLVDTTNDKLFRLQCCHESQHSLPCTHVISSFNGRVEIKSSNLSPLDCVAIGYTINKSNYSGVNLIFNRDTNIGVTGAQALGKGLKNCTNINKLK